MSEEMADESVVSLSSLSSPSNLVGSRLDSPVRSLLSNLVLSPPSSPVFSSPSSPNFGLQVVPEVFDLEADVAGPSSGGVGADRDGKNVGFRFNNFEKECLLENVDLRTRLDKRKEKIRKLKEENASLTVMLEEMHKSIDWLRANLMAAKGKIGKLIKENHLLAGFGNYEILDFIGGEIEDEGWDIELMDESGNGE